MGLGYSVATNRAFTDPEEGKSRELDVWAYKSWMNDTERRVNVACSLLVECKNTTAPFAFLTRPLRPLQRAPEEFLFTLHTHESPYEDEEKKFVRRTPAFYALGLDQHYWATVNPVKAVHISRLDRKGGTWHANNTGVFESLTYPMAKALRVVKASFRNPNRGFNADRDWSHVLMFVPVAVIASKLFVVDGTLAEPAASEIPHVRFQRELKAKSFDGVFGIDFVQREHLSRFVTEQVEPFMAHLLQLVESDLTRIVPPQGWPMADIW